jgi:hypothetical protein
MCSLLTLEHEEHLETDINLPLLALSVLYGSMGEKSPVSSFAP